MNAIQIIEQREIFGKDFKIYGDIDNPLFLAKDVAEWIEHNKPSELAALVDETEKIKIAIDPSDTIAGVLQANTEYWFLTEDGLYEVLMQSRKPIAKQFKAKVKEILKDVRKRGMYATAATIDTMLADPDAMIELLTQYKQEKIQRQLLEHQKENLQQQLDESQSWYTIKRVAAINGIDWKRLHWRELKQQSIRMNKQIQKIFDANFGEVNSYHVDVFKALYPQLKY